MTQNDSSAELQATINRGPLAVADDEERINYLLCRKRYNRAPAEKHAVLHVLCYQRRLAYIKRNFFQRGKSTPLGILQDWWPGFQPVAHLRQLTSCIACS